MKKAIVILGVILFASFLFTSCGSKKDGVKKAKDIDVEDLEEPCDYADAMLIVMEEMKDLREANKDISLDDIKGMHELSLKLGEIEYAMDKKKVDLEEYRKCASIEKGNKVFGEYLKLNAFYDYRAAIDIKVSDLKGPCDFVDALLNIAIEQKDLKDANKDVKDEDISIEDVVAYKVLDDKSVELFSAMVEAEIKLEDIEKCDFYEEMNKIMVDLEVSNNLK